MLQGFQAFLTLFGVIVIAISLAHMAIGPRAIIGGVAVNPTMAGQDRFFAGGIGRFPNFPWPNSQSCSTAYPIRSTSRCSCSSWRCRH